MYSRNEILRNQNTFSYEIRKWLKKDFSQSKSDLFNIKTKDDEILKEKKKLELRFEKVKIEKEIEKFIINEKNIYPKFYAWWDEINETVEIFLYEAK
jgi:hypothetical protein